MLAIVFLSACSNSNKQKKEAAEYRDLYSDTWVATDAVGRTMPGVDSVGTLKTDKDRTVGIFYITWHTQEKASLEIDMQTQDVSAIFNKDNTARLDGSNPAWGEYSTYFWGEPEMGYFLSQDEWVIRKDMSMLADAGVDVLIMDVTNAVRYWDEWEVTFSAMHKMKEEGNKVPKFVFWAFNGPVITVVQDLYERVYEEEKYKDLWFYWEDKPLLLYNPTPTVNASESGTKHPNLHYDSLAVSDVNHPNYGNTYYTKKYYTDYSNEVKEFFTLRNMWWGYHEWNGKPYVGGEDNWSFGYDLGDERVLNLSPKELASKHNGEIEEFAVTPAQHSHVLIGKSWTRKNGQPELDEYDMPKSAYVPYLDSIVENPTHYGLYFQERWDEAISVDPKFLYINDWNEWTAGRYSVEQAYKYLGGIPENLIHKVDTGKFNFMNRASNYVFIDQFNAEFNRGIQPMKGGYTDNYYMQMAQNIRRYKGVRPIPENKGYTKIDVDAEFSDWDNVDVEYRDTKGDVFSRDAIGYGKIHYENNSGRNDIITSKVAVDENNIYFYAETDNKLTSHNDKNWMLLYIDADNDSKTGWYGYDFVINKNIVDENKTILLKVHGRESQQNGGRTSQQIKYQYKNNKIEIQIPRNLLGINSSSFQFDFKWSDNAASVETPISFALNGDAAPNRRFNYRFKWNKK